MTFLLPEKFVDFMDSKQRRAVLSASHRLIYFPTILDLVQIIQDTIVTPGIKGISMSTEVRHCQPILPALKRTICARYSVLLNLPYFDVIRCHLVDPMHNLLLGTAKNMMSIWKDAGLIPDSTFLKIQQEVDSFNLPAGIGRIPGKIEAGLASFTAEQWKTWTTVLSPYVLKKHLPPEHYKLWCIFAKACTILCRPNIHVQSLQQADDLLIQFCKHFEALYGKHRCTPALPLTRFNNRCWSSLLLFVLLVRTL